MNPKIIDRLGKVTLIVLSTAIAAASKKYGPKILKKIGQLLPSIILRR